MAGWEYLSIGFGQTNPKNILNFWNLQPLSTGAIMQKVKFECSEKYWFPDLKSDFLCQQNIKYQHVLLSPKWPNFTIEGVGAEN